MPSVRLTISGKRKGVWTGQSLDRKFAVALGWAGPGCDRQILSRVRLPAREDAEPPAAETAGSGALFGKRGSARTSAGKPSRRPLSSCACGLSASALPTLPLYLGQKRISRDCPSISDAACYPEQFITNSLSPPPHPPGKLG